MSRFRGAQLVLAVLIALLICVQFFSAREIDWDGFVVHVSLSADLAGGTQLSIPPVGSVTARTHPLPVRIEVSLREVELQAFSTVLDGVASGAFLPNLGHELSRQASLYIISLMGATGVLAAGMALVFNFRHRRHLILVFAAGVVVVGILASGVYATYDVTAFDQYSLDGPVADFPDAWQVMQQGMDQLEELRRQMQLLGSHLMGLYEQWGSSGGPGRFGEEEFTLLVISDVHNNVPALDFVRGMIGSYPVRAVVDLGDLTDWGTPVEARIVEQIEQMNIPYIFVPGNHETPLVVQEMASLDNVTVLEGTYAMDDLVLVAYPDPGASCISPREASPEQLQRLRDVYREGVREANALWPGGHVLLAAHHPGAVRELGSMPSVQTVLSGHTHSLRVEQAGDTLYLDPGTTGASGVRGLMAEREIPHTALLLHFAREEGNTVLIAVDSISLNAGRDELQLRREFHRPLLP